MAYTVEAGDEQMLLDLLNTTPVVNGDVHDLLATDDQAHAWAQSRGGIGSRAETGHLRQVRDRLQAVVRGEQPPSTLASALLGVQLRPDLSASGVSWRLDVDDDRRLATRAVLAWAHVWEQLPGRLRPCVNDECRLFLLDRSRANVARWCSMKICGNRMKVRRHYRRSQLAD